MTRESGACLQGCAHAPVGHAEPDLARFLKLLHTIGGQVRCKGCGLAKAGCQCSAGVAGIVMPMPKPMWVCVAMQRHDVPCDPRHAARP